MNASGRWTEVAVGGLMFTAATPEEAAAFMIQRSIQGPPAAFHFMNAYSVVQVSRSATLRDAIKGSVVFPDGKPIAWFGGRGSGLRQVRGPQAFEDVLDRGRQVGLRHYLLGASEETLAALKDRIEAGFPGALIVGAYSPPFRLLTGEERKAQDDAIVKSRADIVWVGLGTPKQDFETVRIFRELSITSAAVGAAFDFTAGTKRVAPAAFRAMGLEWLFRFMSEPRRLWRRYLIGNIQFLYLAVSALLRQR